MHPSVLGIYLNSCHYLLVPLDCANWNAAVPIKPWLEKLLSKRIAHFVVNTFRNVDPLAEVLKTRIDLRATFGGSDMPRIWEVNTKH